jgi:hypothetical protein
MCPGTAALSYIWGDQLHWYSVYLREQAPPCLQPECGWRDTVEYHHRQRG